MSVYPPKTLDMEEDTSKALPHLVENDIPNGVVGNPIFECDRSDGFSVAESRSDVGNVFGMKSSPAHLHLDPEPLQSVANGTPTYVELRSYLTDGHPDPPEAKNFPLIFLSYSCSMVVVSKGLPSVSDRVFRVFLVRSPAEILQSVVPGNSVEMTTLHPLWTGADEGDQHHSMQCQESFPTFDAMRDVSIPSSESDLTPFVRQSPPLVVPTPERSIGPDLVERKPDAMECSVANSEDGIESERTTDWHSRLPLRFPGENSGQAAGNTALRVYSPSPSYFRDSGRYGKGIA